MSTEPMELNRLLGQLAYAIGAEREEGGLDAGGLGVRPGRQSPVGQQHRQVRRRHQKRW